MASEKQYLQKLKKHNIELYNYFLRGMEIVETLNSKMHEAYIVGGAVRDYLLGAPFKDIDIATTATPKEVLELFPDGNGRFSELGCVELREDNRVFQITTFRDEHLVTTRKTKNIHYSKKLTDDVLRRDFTINALALSSNYNIIDLVKGCRDLKKGIIRVIGKGTKRFREDPIRILRGFELMSRYGFNLSGRTSRAMYKSRKYIKDISNYKLTEMLDKIMQGKYARYALAQMSNLNIFGYDEVYRKWLVCICSKYKKTDNTEKLALLYHMYGSIPKNSAYDKKTISDIEKLIHMVAIVEEQPIDEMMIYKYGGSLVYSANQILVTKGHKYKNKAKLIKKIIKNMPISDRRDMNFTTEELIQMMNGQKGPKITEIMDLLISKVVKGEVLNTNACIRQEALRLINFDRNIQAESLPKETQESSQIYQDNVQVTEEPQPVINIDNIKNEYAEEFKNLYATYMRNIPNYSRMTDEEKASINYQTKVRVKNELLSRNPKYRILVERGII